MKTTHLPSPPPEVARFAADLLAKFPPPASLFAEARRAVETCPK